MSVKRIAPAALLSALSLSACVSGGPSTPAQQNSDPFLYQARGVAHAPAVSHVEAASYNAVLGDRYYPQPGEFFFFKQVGVMIGNNGFRASRDGGAFWVTFAHSPQAQETGINLRTGNGIEHSEVVAIPPGETRTYTAGEAVMTITTPSDIAREDEIVVSVERGAMPNDPMLPPNGAPQGDPNAPAGYAPASWSPNQPAPAPVYHQPQAYHAPAPGSAYTHAASPYTMQDHAYGAALPATYEAQAHR